MKKCSICKEFKNESEFSKNKIRKDGLHTDCKDCANKINKTYREEHKEEIKEKDRIRHKEYYEENKEKINKKNAQYKKEQMQANESFRIILNLRRALRRAYQLYSTTGKIMKSKEYGIDYKAIFDYIGHCPGDRKDWQIDHIIALCSFDFDDIEQVRKAFAPENHRWLRKEENLKKISEDKKTSIKRRK